MKAEQDDDFEDFDYKIPKRAGYIVQRIDACSNCRFCDGDQEGVHYCKLYVEAISTRGPIWQCHFVRVNENGKCRHYKPEKEKYRLGGAASMDAMDLCFGNSQKKEDREPRYSYKDVADGLKQLAKRDEK
jgi:hypothetical protein